MIVQFSKYHGTGNDFIMIDGRNQDISGFNDQLISQLCHRRFGIGADGLIILEESRQSDFRMRYFNSDGREGTMCGNGGRCIVLFASRLGIIQSDTVFEGIDGRHHATLLHGNTIRLKLKDVNGITPLKDGYLLDTGSPHFVKFVPRVEPLNVEESGREIRNQVRFGPGGVNVNFVALSDNRDTISVRTYERGVEAETYSCGTGVTASAICTGVHFKSDNISYRVETRGGTLLVDFNPAGKDRFTDVTLTGEATEVYKGSCEI